MGTVPKGVGFWILRHEVAGFFTEVGDGTRFGKREWTAGILFFEIGHCFGEKWSEGTGIFEVDGLEGEAAGLVEEADVACGELGSCGSGLINNGNADAMPVPDKGNFQRAKALEMADRIIGAKNNHGIGLRNPVRRQFSGHFDESLKWIWDFEI